MSTRLLTAKNFNRAERAYKRREIAPGRVVPGLSVALTVSGFRRRPSEGRLGLQGSRLRPFHAQVLLPPAEADALPTNYQHSGAATETSTFARGDMLPVEVRAFAAHDKKRENSPTLFIMTPSWYAGQFDAPSRTDRRPSTTS